MVPGSSQGRPSQRPVSQKLIFGVWCDPLATGQLLLMLREAGQS